MPKTKNARKLKLKKPRSCIYGGQGGGTIAAWPPNGSGGVFSGNIWDDTLAPLN